jgi:post-segregation antitoxin (ccd killing protein)
MERASFSTGGIMTTIQFTLPDQLAEDARRAGLLSSQALERLLREELEEQLQGEFFEAVERMSQVADVPVMSPEEVAEEIRLMRAERRRRSFE